MSHPLPAIVRPARLLPLLLALVLPAFAADAETDRYRLSWRDDPSTTMVVGWDQVSGHSPTLHWGPEDQGQAADQYPNASGVDVVHNYRGMRNHFVRLTGLRPDTAYYFVIKDSDSTSRRYWFRTAPAQPQPFAFVAGGDTRTNAGPRRRGNTMVSKLRPLFVCIGGDYMGVGAAEEWLEWFDDWQLTISEDGRMYPLVAAHGNHENRDLAMVHRLFDTPRADMYFALSFGGDLLRMYTLNTEIIYTNANHPNHDLHAWAGQNAWFESDLRAHPDVTWKMVQYHRPMRAHTAAKAEGLHQIAAWAHLFYEHGIDLVIECDTHMVKRTYPLRPSDGEGSYESFVRDDENGTVFIGEGSWGAPIRPANDDKPWTMASDSFHQFKWVQVSPEHVDIRSVRFENVADIAEVSDAEPFTAPDGLMVWEPPTGAVLRLPFSTDNETYIEGGRWTELMGPRSQWRYHDGGALPAEGWFAADYDDSDWATGQARLGYGNDGEATTLSFGDDASRKHPAAYFRTTFTAEAVDTLDQVFVEVLADDGFVAYLNGEEIGRRRLPEGPVTHTTYATGHPPNESHYDTLDIDPKLLNEGENTLAVEVHQRSGDSSDLALNARVRVLRTPETE